MKYVLDASVAVKTMIPEIDSGKAIALMDDFKNQVHELIAPETLLVEVCHVLTRTERRQIIKPQESIALFQSFSKTLPQMYSYVPLLGRALENSSHMRTGVFDCLYAALAEREGATVITADKRMQTTLPGFSIVTLDSL